MEAAAAAEDALVRQVLAVSLDPEAAKAPLGDAPVVYLRDLAQVRWGRAAGAAAGARPRRARAHSSPLLGARSRRARPAPHACTAHPPARLRPPRTRRSSRPRRARARARRPRAWRRPRSTA